MTESNCIKRVIIVLSGKGGVGKSTVACQLALSLAASSQPGERPLRVGILDIDITGPSVPKICGVEGASVLYGPDNTTWVPVEASTGLTSDSTQTERVSVKVMSIAFLLNNTTDAVIWRGPRKDAIIRQFISNVIWGELDYLIVDTPPGTSDEHLTLCECLKDQLMVSSHVISQEKQRQVEGEAAIGPVVGAVVVTTPQQVATDDVKKELSFCAKLKLRCLGVVENMSGFVCPSCATCTTIFGKGGGAQLAAQYGIPFLGAIPIDPMISMLQDLGRRIGDISTKSDVAMVDSETTGGSAKHNQTVFALQKIIHAILMQIDRAEESLRQQVMNSNE